MTVSRRTALLTGAVVVVAAVVVAMVIWLPRGESERTAPSSTPASTTPVETTSPTSPPTPSPTPSPSAPTTVPASSASPVPDPRSIPIRTLLRPGTEEDRVLYGDLNRDGIEEIVLQSHATAAPAGGGPPQPYLDVFAYTGPGYARVFDATADAPPGAGAPATMIEGHDPSFNAQAVTFLDLVDFRGDASPEVVAGVEVEGATVGPLGVWIIGMDGSRFVTRFFEQTQRGGTLAAVGDTLRLETGRYRPGDPGCCPSRISHQVIAYDPARDRIRVVRETFTPGPGA